MRRLAAVLSLLMLERLIAMSGRLDLWSWIGVQTVLFSLVPILFLKITGAKRNEVGLVSGDLGFGLKIAGLMLVLALPFMIYGAGLPSFQTYYPIWPPARESIFAFIILELAVLVMMFNTEFMFRGLLLFSLKKKTKNFWLSIGVHAFIYMIVHIGKPGLEVPYSWVVGIDFGWLALRSGSMLPTLFAHWTSSVIFDFLAITL